MFGGPFSLNKFSLGKEISDIPIRVFLTDSLKGAFGFGEDLEVSAYLDETIGSNIILTISTAAELKGAVFLLAKIAGDVVTVIENHFHEALDSQTKIAANMSPLIAFSDHLMTDSYLSQDFQATKTSFIDAVQFNGYLAKNLLASGNYGVILGNIIDADVLEQIICQLNVTIPAGGILEIDSDLFTAYLNNQNVLHLQSGDWIFFDRDLVTLQFNDVGGNARTVDITVFYNERYL